MISDSMFNKTCTIVNPGVTKSTSGAIGPSGSPTTLVSSLPCALQIDSSSNTVQYRMERNVRAATLYIRPTTPDGTALTILSSYQITVDGETWDVVGPSVDASGGRGVLLRVPLESPL